MSEQKSRAVCVGEVMIELLRGSDGRFAIACGGDTFNTAVYLARAGADVAFATALGHDPYSDAIMALIAAEGVASDPILRVHGRLPGLYVVDVDPAGKQHFNFWRDEAPARDLFELPDWNRVAASLITAKLVYFSGITLALYSSPSSRWRGRTAPRSRSTPTSVPATGRAICRAPAPCSWRH
jgi:2-dehydro-3-deoxygluconokinase